MHSVWAGIEGRLLAQWRSLQAKNVSSLTIQLLHFLPVHMFRRSFEHSVVVLVSVEQNPELWPDKSEHELHIPWTVFFVKGFKGAPVIDVLDLAENSGGHGKEVASVYLESAVFGLEHAAVDLWDGGFDVVQLVLDEDGLGNVWDAFKPGDLVAFVVEPDQIHALSAQGKEDLDLILAVLEQNLNILVICYT